MELMKSKSCEYNPKVVLILAHGAGAPADSPFMAALSEALDAEGIANLRFEFEYMQKRRADGKKRPPDRQPKLLASFAEVVDQVKDHFGRECRLLVGGKSMGGRMASILASERSELAGVVCYGYPFHPPGKPDRWRTDHFPSIRCPLLIVQGTRDPFGKPEELAGHRQSLEPARLVWLDGGNHDFLPPARQAESQDDLIRQAARETRAFIEELS